MKKKTTPTKLKKSKSEKSSKEIAVVIKEKLPTLEEELDGLDEEIKPIDLGNPMDDPDDEPDAEESEEDEDEDEIEAVIAPVKRKGKPPTDKANFYVDPKEFDSEIVIYYDTGKMSDNLALMIDKISNKLSYAPNFLNYTFREEMVGDGIIRMFKALMTKKYDRVKGTNPFAYFTRIAFNAFRNRIKKEKRMRDTHQKYQEEYEIYSSNYNTQVKNSRTKNKRDSLA